MAEPDPPPRLDNRTARHALRHSLASFFSAAAFPSLLLAALLLLSFRSALLAGTLRLSSIADRDPAVRSLLRRLSPSSDATSTSSPAAAAPHLPPHNHNRRRGGPFLQITRVGTLDDDLFSDSDSLAGADRRSAFFRHPFNASRLFLLGDEAALAFPRSLKPLKFRVPEFPSASPFLFHITDADDAGGGDGDRDRPVDLRIFGKGFDLGREEAATIVYLLTLLSSSHALAILGYILAYTSALGIVFVSITAFHLQRSVSAAETIYSGVRLGIQQLTGFVFLRWAARDALIQFLCIWFFADVQDQNELFKLFVKVKLMPFSSSPLNPWSGPHDQAISGFFFMWAMVDTIVSIVFAFVPWVVIMDHNLRRRGPDVLKEGFYLISLIPGQAILIKFLEAVVCGSLGMLIAMTFGGRLFAAVLHSLAEVYFVVVWLVLYFVARSKDGDMAGRRFGQRDLEECLNRLG